MKTFNVFVREVHIQTVKVTAKNEKEAISKVKDGEGDYIDGALEYSHTLDSDTWSVESV